MTVATSRPDSAEYAPYYARYVEQVPEGDVVATLRQQAEEMQALLAGLPPSRGGHRYAPDKWTVREVLGHLVDCERIFTYRALRIARGDKTPLASFDQNEFVRNADSDRRTIADLADELRALRQATVALFATLSPEAWSRTGTASDVAVSVRGLAFIVAGHTRHHLTILRERYLAD